MAEIAGVVFTEAIAKKIFSSMEKLAAFARDDVDTLDYHVTAFGDFMTAINPFVLPFKTIIVKIQSETMDETMEIMKAALELLKNPMVADAIERLGNGLSTAISTTNTAVSALDDGLTRVFETLKKLKESVVAIPDVLQDTSETVVRTLQKIWNKITGIFR